MRSDVIFNSPYLDRCLRFGWYLDIIMLLLLGDIPMIYGPDLVVDMDDWDCTFDDGWSDVCFFIYHTSDAIIGHISLSVEIYRSSWSYMIISTYEIHIETMTCLLTYHDPLVEPLLGHSIKPTLLIFRCSHVSSSERHALICGSYSPVDMDD